MMNYNLSLWKSGGSEVTWLAISLRSVERGKQEVVVSRHDLDMLFLFDVSYGLKVAKEEAYP